MIIILFKKDAINTSNEKSFYSLGTINRIVAYGKDSEGALYKAYKRVLEIDDRVSAFKDDSDIAKINRCAGQEVQKVNADTFNLLKCSLEFSSLSNGAFDITIRPLTKLWDIGKKQNYIPPKEEIEQVLPLINYRDLVLDEKNCTAYLNKKGQAIDLGGIAKGYAADEVKRILLENKIDSALINLGGNIVTVGNNQGNTPWRIGIQNPLAVRGQYIGSILSTNQTIVTSGSNEQFFIKDGIRYHHILSPLTGYPVNKGVLSITAICECSRDADALTTALFVTGIDNVKSLLSKANAQAIFIMNNGDIFMTEGLRNTFERSFK
ncbi:FAD:protein FMN transferase [Clostridium omnivorum]|uniref:FAD:protein FMN transferase n=1 Tax=Clostridium omnivorum TaxID=1604902 RepID=A0ABQ5NBU0_9CLOT|nr:FAD:protein FMN transferase [Clostridium sp. E14]GLC32651.1 FAD:protein FMN transferase [Clostridium sp. E14]